MNPAARPALRISWRQITIVLIGLAAVALFFSEFRVDLASSLRRVSNSVISAQSKSKPEPSVPRRTKPTTTSTPPPGHESVIHTLLATELGELIGAGETTLRAAAAAADKKSSSSFPSSFRFPDKSDVVPFVGRHFSFDFARCDARVLSNRTLLQIVVARALLAVGAEVHGPHGVTVVEHARHHRLTLSAAALFDVHSHLVLHTISHQRRAALDLFWAAQYVELNQLE